MTKIVDEGREGTGQGLRRRNSRLGSSSSAADGRAEAGAVAGGSGGGGGGGGAAGRGAGPDAASTAAEGLGTSGIASTLARFIGGLVTSVGAAGALAAG